MMQQLVSVSEDLRKNSGQFIEHELMAEAGREMGVSSSLKALFLKSVALQKRNYCSNICQMATPLLCILFSLAIKEIVGNITTGAVYTESFPRPFNMPELNAAVRPSIGLVCGEVYYYQATPEAQAMASQLLQTQLFQTCPDGTMSPRFDQKDNVNRAILDQVKLADVEQFERGDDLKTQLPDGLIKFKQANKTNVNAVLGINDFRLPQYHKNNGVTKILVKTSVTTTISTYQFVTEGTMSLIDKLSQAFLQQHNPKEIIAGSYLYMPFSGEDKSFVNKMINVIGSGLYPLGLSLLLPVLLFTAVSEKEERQVEIMKMNGLDGRLYWVNFMVVSLLLSFMVSFMMYLFGIFIVEVPFFEKTSAGVIWLMFVGWAIAQASMASFFQVFLDSARMATIIGYVISIFSTLVGMALCTGIFPYPMQMPTYLALYPPFALSRAIYYMGMTCSGSAECYHSVSELDSEAATCIIILYAWFFVYLFSIWLSGVVQQEYGVAKRPQIIQKCLRCLRRKRNKDEELAEEDSGDKYDVNHFEGDMQQVLLARASELIDGSVRSESEIAAQVDIRTHPLIIRGIHKRYELDNGEGRTALHPTSLTIKRGEIFGLLGPNGAGKTTLISVLTGMYPPTSGQAWIGSLPVGETDTNKRIGVCPQFDILWRNLTVEEHLLFYSRLKGVPANELTSAVKDALEEVDLWDSRQMTAGQLSGGMQRRLSIASALVGRPSVVFLDEPSSGLDPFHRRQIWEILARCKRRTSIFLTSHLMDEVEFLCDRIGVISQGKMRCVGGLQELKDKFGDGYRLTISYSASSSSAESGPKRHPVVAQLMNALDLRLTQELETRTILRIDKQQVLRCAQLLRQASEVEWSIASPSLYDVFMHFVG